MSVVSKSLLVDVILIVALLAVGASGYFLSDWLAPQVELTVAPDPGCDLNAGPCEAMLPDGGRLRLELTPRPLPQIEPMQLSLEIAGGMPTRCPWIFPG